MIRRWFMALNLALLCLFAAPLPATAGLFSGVDCNDSQNRQSAVCSSRTSQDPIAGQHGLLLKVTDIIALIAGAAAVIIIIVSGLRYVTAGGDSGKVSSAKNTLIGAIIGLIVVVLARTLVVFVVNRL